MEGSAGAERVVPEAGEEEQAVKAVEAGADSEEEAIWAKAAAASVMAVAAACPGRAVAATEVRRKVAVEAGTAGTARMRHMSSHS